MEALALDDLFYLWNYIITYIHNILTYIFIDLEHNRCNNRLITEYAEIEHQ